MQSSLLPLVVFLLLTRNVKVEGEEIGMKKSLQEKQIKDQTLASWRQDFFKYTQSIFIHMIACLVDY